MISARLALRLHRTRHSVCLPSTSVLPSCPPRRSVATVADPVIPHRPSFAPVDLPQPRGLATGRYQASDPHPSHAIVGSAGKGATPNYGRRNRIRKPEHPRGNLSRPHEPLHSPGLRARREQIEKEQGAKYVHEYSPSTRTKRPLPQHTYFSPPSDVVSAAGVAGVGGALPSGGELKRKKTALIFAGQGSQYIGMAAKLSRTFASADQTWTDAEEALLRSFDPADRPNLPEYATPSQRAAFEAALATTAYADPTREANVRQAWLRDTVFNGDQLNLTRAENAWPAIFTATMTFLQVMRNEFSIDLVQDHVQAAVGHGMGNLASLVTSGAMEFTDGVRLLRHYGLASTMHLRTHPTFCPPGSQPPLSVYDSWGFTNATEQNGHRVLMSGVVLQPGKFHAALMEIEASSADIRAGRAEGVASDEYVEVANYNSSMQVVLGGTKGAVRYVSERLRQGGYGAKAVNLPVSGPYFTSAMKGAADFVRPAVSNLPLTSPTGPNLISPYTGEWLCTPQDIRSDLQGALAKPVRWLESIENLLHSGVERFICLGPGRACGHLLSKELAYRDQTARHLASKGLGKEPRAQYEVWSVASTEDIVQLGGMLQQLSLTDGASPVVNHTPLQVTSL